MNILQIIPGSGGSFYCGNCLRDSKYYDALRSLGHDVVKVPMYLPLFADEHDINEVPVFYGAVSIYLKQLYPVFRHAPQWFDRMLNSKPLLKLAAGMAGSTNAKGLEEMTISMLKGEHGRQHEELDRMIEWIRDHYKADVIHLSNALLSGLAHRIKEKLDTPLFCSLQDEDVWIDVMKPEFREQAWQLMRENGEYIDGFISVSHYFSRFLKEKLAIPEQKLTTIHLGIDPADYQPVPVTGKPLNIGYISRMCYDNGLDILLDAFVQIRKDPRFKDVKLIITGGSTGADKKYIRNLRKTISANGLENQVEFLADFENKGRMDFFRKVSVVSVPVRNGEAFGLYLLEAMASGVPVVQPALGAFPEIIEKSGGGIIYTPNNPDALADALGSLLTARERLGQLSANGRTAVERNFNIYSHAVELVDWYQSKLNS